MATETKKINTYPTSTTVGADDYFYKFDSQGSGHMMKVTDLQAVTPPPIEWRDYILNDVKIAYNVSGMLYTADLSELEAHRSDFISLCIPKFGLLVYPEMVERPWGIATKKCISTPRTEDLQILTCGLADTLASYNADNANKGNDCAVGYACNFEKFVGGRGVPKGNWYLPSDTECTMVLSPLYKQLKYASSLLGFNWPQSFIWQGYDKSQASASSCVLHRGSVQTAQKSVLKGVLMLAKMTVILSTQTT